MRDALSTAGVEALLPQAGHADDHSLSGIRITKLHGTKGREISAVAIPFLSEGGFPPAGALKTPVDAAHKADIIDQHRSLLRVAVTSAKRYLRVS